MTINLSVPQTTQELRPKITVIGVGGAGCNAVNNMIQTNLEGVEFLVANTDGQALAHSLAPRKLQIGSDITRGLGAGSRPDMGRRAAEESLEELLAELGDSNMVFITAGMGGGTGTGAAPVIARAAREAGILTVGVVTKPFEFEGQRRMAQAEEGIKELQGFVDTLIVIPNQNLFRLANERTTFADAFHMADTVLHQGVCGVTDLMIKPGTINLDFADIKAVMTEMGKAMMGTGEASGENRATEAAEAAINNPLLDDTSMKGARALLINITGGQDMTLFEVDEAANRIRREVDPDATIIFGSASDDRLDGVMRVSVVATGIDALPKTASLFGEEEAAASRQEQTQIPLINTVMPKPETAQPGMAGAQPAPLGGLAAAAPQLDRVAGTDPVAAQPAEQTAEDAAFADPADPQIAPAQTGEAETGEADAAGAEIAGAEIAGAAEAQPEAGPASPEPAEDQPAPFLQVPDEAPREPFIPAAAQQTEDEQSVPETDPAPKGSLMQRISGLWSQSAETPPAKPEPRAADVLDLPRVDMNPNGQTSLAMEPETAGDDSTEELDIPAFLRRQAN